MRQDITIVKEVRCKLCFDVRLAWQVDLGRLEKSHQFLGLEVPKHSYGCILSAPKVYIQYACADAHILALSQSCSEKLASAW